MSLCWNLNKFYFNQNTDQMEDCDFPTEKYTFEKLDEKVNKVFSEYGERRWLFIVIPKLEPNRIEEDQIYNILKTLKWTRYNDCFLSPTPIQRGDESTQVIDLFTMLEAKDLIAPKSYDYHLHCTIGKIALESLSK